ncbi:MAG: hypothetical protein IT210_16875 [Armatimonadetes bacterium]|nr:hypothetical protein [Armatimonadota bacterium]
MQKALAIRLSVGLVLSLSFLASLIIPVQAQQTNPSMTVYFAVGEKYPKGLSDFQCFGLARKGKNKFEGWVMTDRENPDNSTLDMKTVRLDGKRLLFRTVNRKGLAFSFQGRFLRAGDMSRFYGHQTPVIEGTVRKFLKGKKAAQGKMRFYTGPAG